MRKSLICVTVCIAAAFAALCAPARAARPPVKPWTIMVYINGKNNLEDMAFYNFFQMESVGSTSNVNVVVQLGRTSGSNHTSLDGGWTGCRRYLIEQHVDTDTISSPMLSSTAVCDMGDYNDAIDFFAWAKSNYPAQHYMTILWDHGSGWWARGPIRSRGIAFDDETGHNITTPQMGLIMSSLTFVDIYGSDACMMQTAEVAYEIKDYVDYVVGSQENEPGEGYQYANFLAAVNASDLTPMAVASAAVQSYIDQYSDQATQSYAITSQLSSLVTLLDVMAAALQNANEHSVVDRAAAETLVYGQYGTIYAERDLAAFADRVAIYTSSAPVRAAAQAVSAHVRSSLIPYNRTKGSAYAKSYGMSIHLPDRYSMSGYADLAFAADSGWPDFLVWLYGTRRVGGVVTSGGLPVEGATVTVTGSLSSSTVTAADGSYSFSLSTGGAYTITAVKAGIALAPVSYSTAALAGNMTADFSADQFVLGGVIKYNGLPLSGVTVTLGGTASGSVLTDYNGAYSFTLPPGEACTLTPSKPGYTFVPASISTGTSAHDQPANDFAISSGGDTTLLTQAASYPNPFAALKGEKARIHYNLDADRECRIRVYNTAGQLVWEHLAYAGSSGGQAGPNEVQWDGRDGDGRAVGRGIYLAAVEAGGARVMVKVGVR